MLVWLHLFTHYLLRNRFQALAITFVIACAPIFVPVLGAFLGMISILIATLITLVKGAREGAFFTAAATLPYGIGFYFSHYHADFFLLMWAAVGVAVLSNVLTWIFAVMLYRKTSWSLILQVAALMGILAISVIHLVYPDVGSWWADQLQQAQHMAESLQKKIATTAAVAPSNKISPLVASDAADVITVTKEYATGLITSAILCSAICQLILARWWQAAIFAPGRLRRELHSIRLSPLAGVLFVVSLVLFYLGNSVVLDIMPVLYMLFGAAGLSTIHYLFRLAYSSLTWFWMLLFYIALIISMPIGLMLITILALLDIWLDFRKRFKKA